MKKIIAMSFSLLFLNICSCTNQKAGTNSSSQAFRIISDREQPIEIRMQMLEKLSKEHINQLRHKLISEQLPPVCDSSTVINHSLSILHFIGNEETLKSLEELRDSNYVDRNDYLHTTISNTIMQLRTRLSEGKRFPEPD